MRKKTVVIMSLTIFIIIGLVSVLSIFSIEPPEYVSIEDMVLTGGINDSLHLDISIRMLSNTGIDAELQELAYRVYLSDSCVADGVWRGELDIPSSGEFLLVLPVNINEDNIPLWIDAFSSDDSTDIFIDCDFKAKAFIFTMNTNVEIEERVSFDGVLELFLLREAISFSPMIVDVSLPTLGLFGSNIRLTLSYSNPYPFPFTIESYNLACILSGDSIGNLVSDTPVYLQPDEKAEQDVVLSVQHVSSISSVISVIRSRSIDVELEGLVTVRIEEIEVEIPIDYAGGLSL